MNTMKKLFNGEIYPFEAMRDTKEMIIARNRLKEYLEAIDEIIPKEDKILFSEKINKYFSELETLTAEQAFEIGFSLGSKLMAESYCEK